ncbi:MAG: bifunctional riboflavin kinase/FAD synthetase [Sulfurimonas sp.]|uniref:bifunctional riboflavin kinase/FAD synthetase n=1 Tax=Sulfurimonas sp. TaxID=2022749 RepID=UPI00262B79F7|nr:bifunctional riboflavin kinase/FAD synthetase [Sulfurimonas sp.]MCW8894285.1 bifunctional riboflavin kinase/FAD synthetase [Sulfurimonas sp.]MCW8953974.1 bifunctional riboflavin kinase/FAD synthetase [Sulfurimonas sp.]MCW9067637.1 bifunctional riboflavin kinase/FAD synthetase [Sulfurimonas sp.]
MKDSTAIAIGGFDGMHIGHQHLFEALGENGTIVVIETGYANLTPKTDREHFSHHPIMYLELGTIRHLSGEEFIAFLKDKFPKLKKIVVGYDFHFGKNRKYSYEDLKTMFDGEVKVIDEVSLDNDSVHSHKIRAKLQIGDIKGANAFLGHNYTIRGSQVTGQGIGKKELVATINLETKGYLIPKEGVYVTLTRIDDEEHYHPSVSFIGHRVTTDGSFAIETHILDGEVLCKEQARISFVSFIRDNKKFDSIDELNKAIKKDIAIASKELKFLAL